MKTRIIVDSTADLMPEYKFGTEEYIDGVTIDHKTLRTGCCCGSIFQELTVLSHGGSSGSEITTFEAVVKIAAYASLA